MNGDLFRNHNTRHVTVPAIFIILSRCRCRQENLPLSSENVQNKYGFNTILLYSISVWSPKVFNSVFTYLVYCFPYKFFAVIQFRIPRGSKQCFLYLNCSPKSDSKWRNIGPKKTFCLFIVIKFNVCLGLYLFWVLNMFLVRIRIQIRVCQWWSLVTRFRIRSAHRIFVIYFMLVRI